MQRRLLMGISILVLLTGTLFAVPYMFAQEGGDDATEEATEAEIVATEEATEADATSTEDTTDTETPTPEAEVTETAIPTEEAATDGEDEATPEATDAEAEETSTTYVVQPGDTLFSIAASNDVTVTALAESNGITDPSVIFVGQTLRIPLGTDAPSETAIPTEAATDEDSEVTPTPTETTDSFTTYIVQPGDTLFSIAARNGVTVSELAEFNNIVNPSLIFWGLPIRIPLGTGGPVATESPTEEATEAPTEEATETEAAATPTDEATEEGDVDATPTDEATEEGDVDATPTEGATEVADTFQTYTVQPGDNLYRISLRFNTSIARLAGLNGITNTDLIFVGQELLVPAS